MAFGNLVERLTSTQLFRAIFRHGRPDSPRNQVLAIISNVFLHLHPTYVRRHGVKFMYTFCLGGLSFLLFLILLVSGVVLMFYYTPSPDHAYRDLKDLEFAVPFGVVLRNAHRWSAHAMVLFVILHMARVFYTGSYKPPREFNWVVGVGLLFVTLLLSFTGYLLPWDQLAYWAITVGTNMARATPLIGHEGPFASVLGARIDNDVRFVLLGGVEVGQAALIRFYVLHCVVLPLGAAALLMIHFWRVRKDGGISGPL